MASPACKRKLIDISDSPSPSPKRPKKVLTLEDKLDLIVDAEKIPKLTQKELSEKYNIGRATVSDILKRKDFYRDQYGVNTEMKKKRFGTSSKYSELNELLYKWFSQARAKNIPLSGPILQEKALYFAKELSLNDFKASNGWLESWRNRFSIGFFKVCGESGDVDVQQVTDFKTRIPDLCAGYSPFDVFNCDETGLFFRALPDKTLSRKGLECKGGKLAKERLTVMMCCSATGEKLKPLVIGKSKCPRCFKNIDTKTLPVYWRSNKKSWMTSGIFSEWITEVNKKMKKNGRNILLFMDNATSHVTGLKLSNVTMKFLPPNTTSKLQPLDLGIIRAFKARYRKHMMQRLVSNIEKCQHASELTKSVSVLDAVYWISKAWLETNTSTIASCFSQAGFPVVASSSDANEEEDPDDDLPLSALLTRNRMGINVDTDVIDEIENDMATEETDEGQWETSLLDNARNDRTVCNEGSEVDTDSENEDDNQPTKETSLTYTRVLTMLDELRDFALIKDDRYLGPVEQLRSITEQTILLSKSRQTQSTLDKFLS